MRRGLAALVMGALVVLAGCDSLAPAVSPAPEARPTPEEPVASVPSAASRALSVHYARVQADLLGQGLLRRDGGGPDVPFNDRTLTDNFVRIALFDEYVRRGNTLVAQQTESQLRRWEVPVRIAVRFGDTVPDAQRQKDRRATSSYARRLARVSGHPVTLSENNPNFHVLILNEDERRGYGPKLQSMVPGIDAATIRTIEQFDRDIFCVVFTFSNERSNAFTHAIAVIRGEHPDLLRLSCLHEEIAQGLGLGNDSPNARPSIFNDDEEFGLLTTHDELLLKILYDPRMRPGMSASDARPIAATIAAELLLSGPS
jgi:hypothetical protein